jgi:xylan 1,4-beta-xylosidase
VAASPLPRLEIHLTEWNASALLGDLVLDTAFMAPFVIANNVHSLELADSLGFWTFTDVFEESPLANAPFHGGFGMLNVQGLQKPAFNGYWFLGRLGSRRIASGDSWIATRDDEDGVTVLLWNYCHYNQRFSAADRSALSLHNRYDVFNPGMNLLVDLSLSGLNGSFRVVEHTFDRENGSVFDAWVRNGAPPELSGSDLEILRAAMHPSAATYQIRADGAYNANLVIRPHGVKLLEFRRIRD